MNDLNPDGQPVTVETDDEVWHAADGSRREAAYRVVDVVRPEALNERGTECYFVTLTI